jgi:hypothetical protein
MPTTGRDNAVLHNTRGNKRNVQMSITFEHVHNSHRPIPAHAGHELVSTEVFAVALLDPLHPGSQSRPP